jgi:lysophospholipase L1-like esterase
MNFFQMSYRVTLVTLSSAAVSFLCAAQPSSPSLALINSPSLPVSRLNEPAWRSRWDAKQKILARTGAVDLLFLGDSITHNYERADPSPLLNYKPVWDYYYASRHAFNLGFSGDTTANLLWRIENGEIDGLTPHLVVLLIGTNNSSNQHRNWSPDATAAAIEMAIAIIHSRISTAQVLVVGILPSHQNEWKTQTDAQVNHLLGTFCVKDRTRWATFIDIGSVFVRQGSLDDSLFVEPHKQPPEGAVHPTAQGQARMAAALEPTIARLLEQTPRPAPQKALP